MMGKVLEAQQDANGKGQTVCLQTKYSMPVMEMLYFMKRDVN